MKNSEGWEGFGDKRGIHLVNWEVVSRSKEKGGLGIGNLVKRNYALLGNWLWRVPLKRNSLWHAVKRINMTFILTIGAQIQFLLARIEVLRNLFTRLLFFSPSCEVGFGQL